MISPPGSHKLKTSKSWDLPSTLTWMSKHKNSTSGHSVRTFFARIRWTSPWYSSRTSSNERTTCTLANFSPTPPGLEAVTIVWIARQFTEEHRATLDWLNESTDEKFNFFGVEVQLFQIGESPVAPHFSVISKPNDWSKTVSKEAKRIELTPTKQLQLSFWTKLREYGAQRGTVLKFQTAEAPELDYPQYRALTLLDGRDDESTHR